MGIMNMIQALIPAFPSTQLIVKEFTLLLEDNVIILLAKKMKDVKEWKKKETRKLQKKRNMQRHEIKQLILPFSYIDYHLDEKVNSDLSDKDEFDEWIKTK